MREAVVSDEACSKVKVEVEEHDGPSDCGSGRVAEIGRCKIHRQKATAPGYIRSGIVPSGGAYYLADGKLWQPPWSDRVSSGF